MPATLLDGDDAARGLLVRVQGVLAQRSELEEFWQGVDEWFVRLADGRAVCAFVVDPPERVAEGAQVTLVGATYKRIDLAGRDGRTRPFPCVVARVATSAAGARSSATPPWLGPLAAVVVALIGGLVLVRRRIRRLRPSDLADARSATRRHAAPSAPDEPRRLPSDPAAALAELRDRQDAG